jgi:hypothetical protein
MLDKLKSKLKEASDLAKSKSAALLPEDWQVPESVAEERLNICKGCENLYTLTNQCRLCGCFVRAKVHLARTKCPINKWERYGRYKDSPDT